MSTHGITTATSTGRRWAVVSLLALAAVGTAGCRRPLPSGADPVGDGGPPPAAAGTTTSTTTTSTTTGSTPSSPAPRTRGPGGAPGSRPGPHPASVRSVDLDRASYPTAACPSAYRLEGDTFTLRSGHAGVPVDGADRGEIGIGVDRKGEAYGDLDGDGREDV